MPFIEIGRRKLVEEGDVLPKAITPGDRCYLYYKKMVDKWKANPRWTTAHEIYKDVITTSYGINVHHSDDVPAKHLAWQIFFIWHVVPYEKEVEERNGSI